MGKQGPPSGRPCAVDLFRPAEWVRVLPAGSRASASGRDIAGLVAEPQEPDPLQEGGCRRAVAPTVGRGARRPAAPQPGDVHAAVSLVLEQPATCSTQQTAAGAAARSI